MPKHRAIQNRESDPGPLADQHGPGKAHNVADGVTSGHQGGAHWHGRLSGGQLDQAEHFVSIWPAFSLPDQCSVIRVRLGLILYFFKSGLQQYILTLGVEGKLKSFEYIEGGALSQSHAMLANAVGRDIVFF